MKIALLTDGIFPYAIGGMQKHSYHLAKQLARQNHTVYLFHCNESTYDISKLEFFTEEEKKNIRSFVIPFPHKNYFPFHYISESKLYSEHIYKALLPFIPEIDFVIAKGFSAWSLLENKKTDYPPVAVHFHGLEMFQHIPTLKSKISAMFLRIAVKKNLDRTDFAISYGGKITYLLAGLVPKNKIWEVPSSIEPSWLIETIQPSPGKTRFVFVGRFERRKGVPELNAAIKQLLPEGNFTFDFIGDIPEEHKIDSPLLHYHGKLSSEKAVKEILSKADVLVSPSFAEGMPVTIMEAMAQGLAIIATDVGAVSTMVNDDNGWLISSPEPTVIAEAMANAIQQKEELQSKKESSLKKVKDNFLLEAATSKLVKLMEANIKNKA
ncbi:MAG TPA: glycosyltransferase family 4 protein [Bacteroidia bacterium]|nr:glycosyltransferase family 4 protein [Bacteroidia bacterium]